MADLGVTCPTCGGPYVKTSVDFGMECANECDRKAEAAAMPAGTNTADVLDIQEPFRCYECIDGVAVWKVSHADGRHLYACNTHRFDAHRKLAQTFMELHDIKSQGLNNAD